MEKPEFLGTNVAACLLIINAAGIALAGAGLLSSGVIALACVVPAAATVVGASWAS